MDRMNRPTPPTSSLPPLARLSSYPATQIKEALDNLRAIYSPPPPPPRIKLTKRNPKLRHLIHDQSVPDSGYVSAEEEDTEDTQIVEESVALPSSSLNAFQNEEEESDLDVLRSDTFERAFAIKWLTGLTARADLWLSSCPSLPSSEESTRALLIDAAASLISAFVSPDPETAEPALTRTFALGPISVSLNDAPLLAADHTSVGLQSWASSILLAERMAAAPRAFALAPGARILELGAGTGLLSIAAAKLVGAGTPIVATDFHADVLANLQRNIAANGVAVDVRALDWEAPVYAPPLDAPFDVVLAADVVYHPMHATWIRQCVVRLLRRPAGVKDRGGVFWMIIAVRATGRHDGLDGTVNEVFGKRGEEGGEEWELAIMEEEELEKQEGRGRADEGGYRLFKIGWTRT